MCAVDFPNMTVFVTNMVVNVSNMTALFPSGEALVLRPAGHFSRVLPKAGHISSAGR